MSNNFVYLKGNCPICQGNRTDCRQSVSTNLYHCRDANANPLNYIQRGSDPHGFFMWADKADCDSFQEEKSQQYREQRLREQEDRLKALALERSAISAASLPVQERHQEYNEKLLAQLTLSTEHRDSLLLRGLTDEQILSGGYRTVTKWQSLHTPINDRLAGIKQGGRSMLNGNSGILCPIKDVNGHYVAAQIKCDSDGSYRWLKGDKNLAPQPTSHLPNGELPLAVYGQATSVDVVPVRVVTPQVGIVGITEGTSFKPHLAHQRLNIPIIGAAGGNWATSASTFKETLLALNAKVVRLFPDAGMLTNKTILDNYLQAIDIAKGEGYQVEVAWWGQVNKSDGDIDEISAEKIAEIKYITCEEFFKMDQVPKPKDKRPVGRPPKISETYVEPEYGRNYWECLQSNNGELGKWKSITTKKGEKTQIFIPQTNFDFKVVGVLEDENGGSLKIEIKPFHGRTKTLMLRTSDTHTVREFKPALSKAYGSKLTCNVTIEEIESLIKVRTQEYYDKGGQIYRLAPSRGRQDNGYWVFEHTQFSPTGQECTHEESGIVFNPGYGDGDAIPSPKFLPSDPEILGKVLKAVREYRGDSAFFPILMVIAGQVAGLYYPEIQDHHSGVPIVNPVGDPNTGKTFATKIARTLVGLKGDSGSFSSLSKSVLYETLKRLSCLSITIDDPVKDAEVEEVFKDIYNGIARTVRGNEQKPTSSVIIASNHHIGSFNNAVKTRVASIPFFKPIKGEGNPEHRTEVNELLSKASGAFSTLLSFGYDANAVNKLDDELAKYLDNTDERIIKSYALLTFYALKLAPYAGLTEEQVKSYVIGTLCTTANHSESKKDSLNDFLEKLKVLHGKGLIGDWDYRQIAKTRSSDGQNTFSTSFILNSVWPVLVQNFDVSYDQGTIKDLITKMGQSGNRGKYTKQRFAETKDDFKIWQNKRASDPNIPSYKTVPKWCYEIYLDEDPYSDEEIIATTTTITYTTQPTLEPSRQEQVNEPTEDSTISAKQEDTATKKPKPNPNPKYSGTHLMKYCGRNRQVEVTPLDCGNYTVKIKEHFKPLEKLYIQAELDELLIQKI